MAWKIEHIPPLGGTARGIIAILVAVSLLSFSDALVKMSGDSFGLAQLVLLRSIVAALLLAVWLLPVQGMSGLRLIRPGWVWARSLCLAAMWLSYYAALPAMSFALAAACYYTAPTWMALLGRVLLGMTIGGRGWASVALSLAGVLLAVSPSADTFTPMLLPLAAAAFYALAGLITWSRCQAESPGAMALTLNLCLVCVAAAALLLLSLFRPIGTESFVLALWPRLTLSDWSLAFVLGCLLAVIATAVATAYRVAPTPVVGVFDTAYLGFAAVWGLLFFGNAPTTREGLGIAMIVCSAILISAGRRQKECSGCRYRWETRHIAILRTRNMGSRRADCFEKPALQNATHSTSRLAAFARHVGAATLHDRFEHRLPAASTEKFSAQ